MSSYGEDIIRETFEKFGDAIGVQMQMPAAMITNLGAVLQAQIDLLAELQSTGRLLADDEQRLTAEQVEDVRALVWLDGRRNFDAFHRLRALFPATEPAGERCQKWTVRVAGGIETGIQCVLPAGHECFHDYVQPIHNYVHPAPAEPAEDETNLAAVAQEPRRFDPADECQNDNHDPGCTCGAQHWMTASAPAEPAEEETKAELPTEVGDRIRASVTRWSSALEWPDSNPYIDTFVLSSSGFWDAENDQFTVVPSCFSYIEVLEVIPSPVVPAPTETEWATVKSDGQQQNPTQSDVGNDKI